MSSFLSDSCVENADKKSDGVLGKENHNTLSSEALMSDLTRIGAYKLLEKQNEGYETN